MLHKELLEILVRIVDAELFETVVIEVLEAEYIEDPYSAPGRILGPVNGLVDLFHDVHEQSSVYALNESVSDINRLFPGQRRDLQTRYDSRVEIAFAEI